MMLPRNSVMLVDHCDEWIGTARKDAAHCSGALHRAVGVFIINKEGKILLHQTAEQKPHSAGLWRNACSAHPMPGEPTGMAAVRGMQHDLCIDAVLESAGKVHYRAELAAGMIEHELVHLFSGQWDGDVLPAPGHVRDHIWVSGEELDAWLHRAPGDFTVAFPQLLSGWRRHIAAR